MRALRFLARRVALLRLRSSVTLGSLFAITRIGVTWGLSLYLLGCGGGGGGTTPTSSPSSLGQVPTPPFSVVHKIGGLNLGPFIFAGQNPNLGTVVPGDQLQFLINVAAQYSTWIRTFGTSNTLQSAGQYIHLAGAKAIIGAYLAPLDPPPSGSSQCTLTGTNAVSNQQELDRLISIANAGQADIIVIGNETLYSGSLVECQLISYITYVRNRLTPGINVQVATTDTWSVLVNHPNVIAAEDVVLASIYPFYENVAEPNAVTQLASDYASIKMASGAKQTIISETGWPSAGGLPAANSPSVPSPSNQLAYFLAAEQWASQNNVLLFWFQGWNEPWKSSATGNTFDAYWGIFDANNVLESQFAPAFQ